MAFPNNQSNFYVNTNFRFENQSYFNGEVSNIANFTNHQQESDSSISVSYSNLEPTAQEFHPSSTNTNNGAIKRKPHQYNRQKDWRYKNNRYGSGRTFNGSKVDYNKYGNKSTEEHNTLQDSTSFLRDVKDQSSERSQSDNLLDLQRIGYFDPKPKEQNNEHFENSKPNVYFESQRSYESPTRSIKTNNRNEKTFKNSYKSEKPNYNNSYDKFKKSNNFQDKYTRNNTHYEGYERGSYGDNRNKYSYRSSSNSDKPNTSYSNYNEHKNYSQESREMGYHQFKPGFRSYNRNNDRFEGRIPKDWRDKDREKDIRSRKKCKL